jgi:hypothetical protein
MFGPLRSDYNELSERSEEMMADLCESLRGNSYLAAHYPQIEEVLTLDEIGLAKFKLFCLERSPHLYRRVYGGRVGR